MSFKNTAISGGVVIIGAAGILGATNPSMENYADFATKEAIIYLETDACTQKLPIVGNSFQDECIKTAQSPDTQARIRSLIIENTDRRNYGIFSLYKTDLTVKDIVPFLPENLLPKYQAESVGVLKLFKTYGAKEAEKP